jgi:hypothetical protein
METAHPPPQTTAKPKLLDLVRGVLRRRHYSIRTEQSYVDWIRRFILFHGKRHAVQMGKQEVTAFLTHLAVRRDVAASTQNQALSARSICRMRWNASIHGRRRSGTGNTSSPRASSRRTRAAALCAAFIPVRLTRGEAGVAT